MYIHANKLYIHTCTYIHVHTYNKVIRNLLIMSLNLLFSLFPFVNYNNNNNVMMMMMMMMMMMIVMIYREVN